MIVVPFICVFIFLPISALRCAIHIVWRTKAWHFQFTSIVEIDRSVPFVELLVPGKSRQRSTPMTAWRTQRLSAPSVCKATLVATVTYVVAHLIIMLTIWLVSAMSVLFCYSRLSATRTTISTISNLSKMFILWSILSQSNCHVFLRIRMPIFRWHRHEIVFFFRTQILVSRFDVVVIISTKKWKYFINAFDDATPTFVSIVRIRCKASSKTKTISSIRRFSSSWSQSISKSKYYCYWIEIVRITSAHTNTFSVHRTVFVCLQCLFHLLCLCQNKRAQNLFVFWILSIRNYTTFQL